MALKVKNSYAPWTSWKEDEKVYAKARRMTEELSEEMDFWRFVQYEFFKQWKKLRSYAGKNGIKIIGDMPIYVAHDSMEVWRSPENFLLDEEGYPTVVAGCPPDAYSEDGQLWGNPIYNWEAMELDGFSWWKIRVGAAFKLYDILRIDHFRGFASFYSIPYGDENAKRGEWVAAPGKALFDAIRHEYPNGKIIAEDLGLITDDVRELLAYTGFPGMKLLQFAFYDEDNEYLPRMFTTDNCIAYTASHDSDCTRSWAYELERSAKARFKREIKRKDGESATEALIRAAMESRANLTVIPMQDYLELNNASGRMNTPSKPDGNWAWRLSPRYRTDTLIKKVERMTVLSKRAAVKKKPNTDKIKYIIFDLDDTLLDGKRAVTPYTKSVLEKLRAIGKVIVINTARSLMFAEKYIDIIDPDYTILNGGAMILDKERNVIYERKIDNEELKALLPELIGKAESVSVQTLDYVYSNDKGFTRFDVKYHDFANEPFTDSAYKILAHIDDENAKYIADKYSLTYIPYFDGSIKRFNHKSATKAIGNKALLKILGATVGEAITFGDDHGDVDMILEAGHGVIMKNATEKLKKTCKNVTDYPNTEDGVARYLEKLFLKKK
jgi:4-alpha-glucanotransferase